MIYQAFSTTILCSGMKDDIVSRPDPTHPRREEKGVWLQYDISQLTLKRGIHRMIYQAFSSTILRSGMKDDIVSSPDPTLAERKRGLVTIRHPATYFKERHS